MADYSKNIVYLSQAQYEELVSNGSITVNDITVEYDKNGIYVTPAEIPVASKTTAGVVKVAARNGVQMNSNGEICVAIANISHIKTDAPVTTTALTPAHAKATAFYGLANAAGDTTQHGIANGVYEYTNEAKAAIAEMFGLPYEKLIYSNDTFGNVWTEYQPTGIDLEDNAIILEDATGIPDSVTVNGTAALVLKPDLTALYGNIPTELYDIIRIKSIGNNRIQFYKANGDLATITDTGYIDMAKSKLLYRAAATPQPECPHCAVLSGHKIHVRLTAYGRLANASGVMAYDGQGNMIRGASYAIATTMKSATGMFIDSSNSVRGMGDIDGYGDIVGNRGIDYWIQMNKFMYSVYDLWFIPDPVFGGCKYDYEFIAMASETNAKNKQYRPVWGKGKGYTNVPISAVAFKTNSASDWIGPNSKFEVWDCGTHF